VIEPTEDEPNAVIAGTADYLSALEVRYDAHVIALRKHAAELQAATARDAAALAEPPAFGATAEHAPSDP